MKLLQVAWRGWLIVFLTSMNVGAIAGHHFWLAFAGGTAISVCWWGNSKAASLTDVRGARWAYGLGAGLGTITGMWAVGMLYG